MVLTKEYTASWIGSGVKHLESYERLNKYLKKKARKIYGKYTHDYTSEIFHYKGATVEFYGKRCHSVNIRVHSIKAVKTLEHILKEAKVDK